MVSSSFCHIWAKYTNNINDQQFTLCPVYFVSQIKGMTLWQVIVDDDDDDILSILLTKVYKRTKDSFKLGDEQNPVITYLSNYVGLSMNLVK